MGQKVNPHGLRVGVIKDWNTTWYADKKEFSKFLKEDNVIRTFLKKKYYLDTKKLTILTKKYCLKTLLFLLLRHILGKNQNQRGFAYRIQSKIILN